jgi:transposase InsO family protein
MPWKETDVVDERMRFIYDYQSGVWTMAELCRHYGIARKTGYSRLKRYLEEGSRGLQDRPYGAKCHPNRIAAAVEEQILQLRREHPSWGPKKLRAYLWSRKAIRWPALSTIGELLQREGLSSPASKPRRRTPPYTQPFHAVEEANQVWCADFKGWFRTRDGERIDPLTITDASSRYLLRCQSVEKTNTEQVKAIFVAAFREYGLPLVIHTDNGAPFASTAIAGLSRLSVSWMKLGIQPERSLPGHPEQNGRHERMHRTLKAETARHPAADRRAQQRVFDRFRKEYNEQRPHEALGQQPPASCYQASRRQYPERVAEPQYGSNMKVRLVQSSGEFAWKHEGIFFTRALTGEHIGLEAIDDRYHWLYFSNFLLARFDSYKHRVEPLPDSAKTLGAEEKT